MDDTRKLGLMGLVVGALICAWQVYEVRGGEHLTFWIVGFIPLPVIVLGILFLLIGLILLIKGD